MGEKHVAVCDYCGREGDLQNPDKLQRFPNRPPAEWFYAGKVATMWDHALPPGCFCSMKCLHEWSKDWANGRR